MVRALLIITGFCVALSACTQRSVCPAFQSAFIYDKEALRKKFSYFQDDSTPKVLTASKNKYLIAEPVSYRKKVASMKTVEMKDVHPVVPDSLTLNEDVSLAELDMAARSVIDSIYIVDVDKERDSVVSDEDSVYVISKDKEVRFLRFNTDSINYKVDEIKYNVEQDNYMWYLRDWLVLPDVRLSQLQAQEEKEQASKKSGFFKNLFKKKKKEEPVDTTAMEAPVEKSEFDFDYNDYNADSTQTQQSTAQPEKKGLFSFLKKKDKSAAKSSNGDAEEPKKKKEKKPKKQKTEDEDQPAEEKKEEQGDDGF